jgi:hypothetical protein
MSAHVGQHATWRVPVESKILNRAWPVTSTVIPHRSHVEFAPPAYCITAWATPILVALARTVALVSGDNHLELPLLGGASREFAAAAS